MPIYQDKDRSILPESRNRGPDRHHDPGPFRLGIPCRNRKRTSGFPSAGRPWPRLPQPSRSLGADGSSSPSGDGGDPSRPAVPCHPHLRKTTFCASLLRKPVSGFAHKMSGFAQVRGLPWGWDIRSLPLPVDSRGGYPPAPPPRPEQGRARCVPVGRRAAPPSIWCDACAPEAGGLSARPPWHR